MRFISFVCLAVGLASTSAAAMPSLLYRNNLTREFGEEKSNLVNMVGNIAVYALTKDKVWRCARNNSWRGIPADSGVNFVRKAYFDANTQTKIEAHVRRLEGMPDVAGTGKLFTLVALGGPGVGISIKINPDVIPASSSHPDMNFLLDTFVHEIGHNMGMTHGPNMDYEENYKGYFVEALGMCARGDGTFPGWPSRLLLRGKHWSR